MIPNITSAKGLATLTGVAILFAATNANVLQTGGWFTSHAMLVATLSLGVIAGARVIGMGAGRTALVIIAALGAGETYNFFATAERVVIEREAGAAPLRDALARHNAAVEKLSAIERAEPSSARLKTARQAKADADDAVTKEASDGCKSECRRKQGLADKAQAELLAAIAEAESIHQGEIEAAQAEVSANPLPASATALADRTGFAAWKIDLLMAALLSFGSNGLAGVLIGFGAHPEEEEPAEDRDGDGLTDIEAAMLRALRAGDGFPGKPTPPPRTRKRGRKADSRIVDFSERFREKHGRSPSGREIKSEFPELPVSTAYDYSSRARVAG